MFYNLQTLPQVDEEMKKIIDKTIDPKMAVTDFEMVTLGEWITNSDNQNIIYCVTRNLPEYTKGLFRIDMEEAEFWNGWDGFNWNRNSTAVTKAVYGNTILKKFVTLHGVINDYYKTIYKMEGPYGTIILVHYQQKAPL